MIIKQTTIINKLGLHARAATKFANTAMQYSSTISVTCNGKSIDGKSIMSLMLLAASKGTEIEIRVDGEDEENALSALIALIDNKFEETE